MSSSSSSPAAVAGTINNGEKHPNEDHQQQQGGDNNTKTKKKSSPILVFSTIGPIYIRNRQFWHGLFFSAAFQGVFLSFVALAFYFFYSVLSKQTWLTEAYETALQSDGFNNDNLQMLQLGNGEWWYVGLLAGAGFAVGLVKVVWNIIMERLLLKPNYKVPFKFPNAFDDLGTLRAANIWEPIPMLICSALSIGLGASCGPEAALGGSGTAFGSIAVARRWKIVGSSIKAKKYNDSNENTTNDHDNKSNPDDQQDNDEPQDHHDDDCVVNWLPDFSTQTQRDLCTLDGIAASFGGLLPSQFLSPLLVVEVRALLGKGGSLPFLETVTRTGIASSIAYVIYTAIKGNTHFQGIPVPPDFIINNDNNKELSVETMDMFMALVLGVLSGIFGLVGLVCFGYAATLGGAMKKFLDDVAKQNMKWCPEDTLGNLLTPTFGGALVGLLCTLCPLCLGDGADQIKTLVWAGKSLGLHTIVASGLCKILCMSISLGFGFVGGPIFPLLFSGTALGVAVHEIVDSVPLSVSVPCGLAALPSAFMPATFLFTTLAALALSLGGAATSPVFFASVSSYATVAGFGVLQDFLATRFSEATEVAAADDEEAVDEAKVGDKTSAALRQDMKEQEVIEVGEELTD